MAKVIKCSRCGKRMRRGDGWNMSFRRGFLIGYLCPECQSPEENAEAEINEATLDYAAGFLDQSGRQWAKSKVAM